MAEPPGKPAAAEQIHVAAASRPCGCARPRCGDTVARVGADCFAVLLTAIDAPADAGEAATRLIAAIAEPIVIDGRQHL